MKNHFTILSLLSMLIVVFLTSSCNVEDPGPVQEARKDFSTIDFDRLEMGSGFNIDVKQGDFFRVEANGDRRNIDDLLVRKEGSTLIIDFSDFHNRKHETYLAITMPSLSAVNFSGATHSTISGFKEEDNMDVTLAGASSSQMDVDLSALKVTLSGASHLRITGTTDSFIADVSGASKLSAFDFITNTIDVTASGASEAKVTATASLHATASGANKIIYNGTPNVTSKVSGASSIQHN